MKRKNRIMNLISSFLIGLLAYYIIARTITAAAVLVCLAAVGVLALGYVLVDLFRKDDKRTSK